MMKQIKIMFTSVGRRVELMQEFRDAAIRRQIKLEIYGADCDMSAPALMFCDKQIQVCKICESEYIPQLLKICGEHSIDLLIPTIDTDLLLLAKNRMLFEQIGTKVLISDEDKIVVCRDKRFTADYFISCGLCSPLPVDDVKKYTRGFPCFIKPKDGSSSVDAYKITNEEELYSFSERVSDYILQPFVEGCEYTVDILCDFEGNPIYVTARKRLAVRSGEVLKTRIVHDAKIEQECMQLIRNYKPCGPITVQLIREKKTETDYYIEINPRFGGGAPLSMKAGADAAGALLDLLRGEVLSYQKNAACESAVYSRFDQSVCVSGSERMVYIRKLGDIQTHLQGLQAVVFDLDDTLYSEKEYVRSGYRQISRLFLGREQEVYEQLWDAFLRGNKAIDEMLKAQNMYSEEMKEKCLRIYRYQKPDIASYHEVKTLLSSLREQGIKLGLLTDGRVEGQRAKIQALKIGEWFDEMLITDEIAGNGDVMRFRKPNHICFEIMQRRLGVPFERMAYVGDNIEKDFQAPKMLGMKAIYFQNEDGIYVGS